MKWALFLLLSAKFTWAGELIVISPSEFHEGDGCTFVTPFADVDFHVEPKYELIQEGQLVRELYKGVPAGKYRVRHGSLGPIGWTESYMETHVTLAKGETKTVYLFKPQSSGPTLPQEILAGIREAKQKHPRAWVELEARYEGAAESFLQYRDLGGQENPERFIHYLRTDAAYTLRVQDFDRNERELKVPYEVRFRVEEPAPAQDPFAPVKPMKLIIEK